MKENRDWGSALAEIRIWARQGPEDVAIMANIVAKIRLLWPEWTWIGFYRVRHLGQDLMVGPFSGPPSPLIIAWGEGVVGSCAAERAVQIVGSIKKFPGYIAAVPQTHSEVSLPIIRQSHVYAVLDCQSPKVDGMNLEAIEWLGEVAQALS